MTMSKTTLSNTYRLGKEPPVVDKRTLRFGKYLTLPTPPPSVTYYEKVASWPMYYNNKYGDCTCAAAGHLVGTRILRALCGLAAAAGCRVQHAQRPEILAQVGARRAQGDGVHQPRHAEPVASQERRLPPRQYLHRRGTSGLRRPRRHADHPMGGATGRTSGR